MVNLGLVRLDVDAAGAVAFEQGEVDPVADLGAGDSGTLERDGEGDFDNGFVRGVEDLEKGKSVGGT